jgi:hypothetical protein
VSEKSELTTVLAPPAGGPPYSKSGRSEILPAANMNSARYFACFNTHQLSCSGLYSFIINRLELLRQHIGNSKYAPNVRKVTMRVKNRTLSPSRGQRPDVTLVLVNFVSIFKDDRRMTQPKQGSQPRLLDQVRDAIRVRHYSIRTEQAYVG